MLLMGLDVGTTSVKAALFTPDGECRSLHSARTRFESPRPGYAEQDARAVFNALKAVMGAAVREAGGMIAALSVSVQGDAVVPVDAQYTPIAPVQLGMDYRCQRQADAFEGAFGGSALFERTGMRPHPMNSLSKIRYITEEMPDVAARARWYMTYSDYILAQLGAEEPVIDESMASRTMAYNLREGAWDDELLRAAGIDAGQLARPVPSGTAVGRIDRTLAEGLGIDPNALLVAGGHDQVCAAVGAGLGLEGVALDSHGTAEVVSTVLDRPNLSRGMYEAGFPCYRYAQHQRYFTFSLNHVSGLLLSEFVREYCAEERMRAQETHGSAYDLLLNDLGEAPSPLLLLPYVNGRGTPVNDLGAKGLVAGLTLQTTRADVARAILEAQAFDLRANLNALQGAGIPIHELRCVGGGAKSAAGLQLKADITGREVATLRQREAACFGAAILAGTACGAYRDISEARSLIQIDRTFAPGDVWRAHYDARYQAYEALYRATRPILDSL